mmetsp:Transcript_15686/g.39856  ORF Transcript_15686/g.39856 Transcript_15686/m.39856 type:complete len:330 (-) Transcript_15686:61-1050(-)
MGQKLVAPPLEQRTEEILLMYNIAPKRVSKLWATFVKMDKDCNGFWTKAEVYRLVQEPPQSMMAPLIDALFVLADRGSDGNLSFEDFVVSFCSYCALGKEEVLQFLFLIVDADRNGYITKDELLDFFSWAPPGADSATPVFPVNNKQALYYFYNGDWERLYFDEFAQLCEQFPYVGYSAFQLQFVLRQALLGVNFWNKWDSERLRIYIAELDAKIVKEKNVTAAGVEVEIIKPGRFTMREILEYTSRKAMGLRNPVTEDEYENNMESQKDRDARIAQTPLLNIIRNPRNAYHVPQQGPIPVKEGGQSQGEEEQAKPVSAAPALHDDEAN